MALDDRQFAALADRMLQHLLDAVEAGSPDADCELRDGILTIEADGIGPFDNYVGALAALATITAGVAVRLRAPAAAHLERIEGAWRRSGALVDPQD